MIERLSLREKFPEINCCACANNWRTPGEFGLPSAGGFSQRARRTQRRGSCRARHRRWSSRSAPPNSTDLTCRWTPTRASRPPLPVPLLTGWRTEMNRNGWSRRPSATAPAASMRTSAGTVSIGTSALRLLLVEFGRSASRWASRLVFVNGHGGNVEALAARGGFASVRGPRRGLVLVQRRERRRARRPYRNLCIATYFAERRVASTNGCPAIAHHWPN